MNAKLGVAGIFCHRDPVGKQLIEEFHAVTTCAQKHCVYDVGSIRSSREEAWVLFQTILWVKADIEISATWS